MAGPSLSNPVDTEPETLDLIFNEIKDSRADASSRVNMLEGKAGFVLGSASLLTSGVAGAQVALAGHTTKYHLLPMWDHFHVVVSAIDIIHGLAAIAVVIYLWIVFFAWKAYMVRKFITISPEILSSYADPQYKQWQVKKMLVRAMTDQYAQNQEKIDDKSLFTERALRGLLVEVVFLAIILAAIVGL